MPTLEVQIGSLLDTALRQLQTLSRDLPGDQHPALFEVRDRMLDMQTLLQEQRISRYLQAGHRGETLSGEPPAFVPTRPEPAWTVPDARLTAADLARRLALWQEALPLSDRTARVLQRNLDLRWTHHSNAIEGNPLSYRETWLLLTQGVVASGPHPYRAHLELQGHQRAIHQARTQAATGEPLTEEDLLDWHRSILVEPYPAPDARGRDTAVLIRPGVYKTAPNGVRTRDGAFHVFVPPAAVPSHMQAFLQELNDSLETESADIARLAATTHHAFVAIHPFADGNGRLARLVTNWQLERLGYPPPVLPVARRFDYYDALQAANAGNMAPLRHLMATCLSHALDFALAVAAGTADPSWRNEHGDPAVAANDYAAPPRLAIPSVAERPWGLSDSAASTV